MEDIAKSNDHTKAIAAKRYTFPLVLIASLSLSGCMGSAFDFIGPEKVDRSIATSTVARNKSANGSSDEATVQNAVSSADLAKLGDNPLPWANAATGSAGVVNAIEEKSGDGAVCRVFNTTRHAYDGIASFYGRTCLLGDGKWHLLAFDRQS